MFKNMKKVKEKNGVIANFTVHRRDRNYYSHLMMRKANQSKVTSKSMVGLGFDPRQLMLKVG